LNRRPVVWVDPARKHLSYRRNKKGGNLQLARRSGGVLGWETTKNLSKKQNSKFRGGKSQWGKQGSLVRGNIELGGSV